MTIAYRGTIGALKAIRAKQMMGKTGVAFDRMMEKMVKKQNFNLPHQLLSDLIVETHYTHQRPYYRIRSKNSQPNHAIIYLFGGGFFLPPQKRDVKFIKSMVAFFNTEVVLPIYPLLPRASFFDICRFELAVYQEILDIYRPENIQFIGLSSGASLSLNMFSYAQRTNKEVPFPKHMVLCSPAAHVPPTEKEWAAMEALDRLDPLLSPSLLEEIVRYMDEEGFEGIRSPINVDMTNICPLSIFMGSDEIFYAGIDSFKEKQKESGAPIRYIIGRNLCHCWMAFNHTAEGRAGRQRIFERLEEHGMPRR